MTKELEERLAALESQLKQPEATNTVRPSQPSKKVTKLTSLTIVFSTLAIIVTGSALYYILYVRDNSSSEPTIAFLEQAQITSGYKLYHASPLPEGYTYKPGSARAESNTISYVLQSGSDDIIIVQQPNPEQQIQLQTLPGFRPVGTPAGQAYSGKANGKPVVILQTETTLVNISASQDTSPEILTQIAKNAVPATR